MSPDFTTVDVRYRDSKYGGRPLSIQSSGLLKTGPDQTVDATGADRRSTSRYCGNRATYRFNAVETIEHVYVTYVIDTYYVLRQSQDTQIGPELLERNLDLIVILPTDRGDDSAKYPIDSRFQDVESVISGVLVARPGALRSDLRRNLRQPAVVESVFASTK